MSIYGTWLILGDGEHEDGCAIYVERPRGSGIYDFSGKPCSCGTPRAPIVYEGSHILPSNDDRRGGEVQVAAIPDFIEREGRPDVQGTGLKDWLRLSVDSVDSTEQEKGYPYVEGGRATVVLNRAHVAELRDTLTAWLEREATE